MTKMMMILPVRVPRPSEYLTDNDHFKDFYNYFQHGIDFLISGTTHTVRKIILHTNIVSIATVDMIYSLNSTTTVAWYTSVPSIQTMPVGDRGDTGG